MGGGIFKNSQDISGAAGAFAPPGAGPESSAGAKAPPGAGSESLAGAETPPGAGSSKKCRGEAPPGAGSDIEAGATGPAGAYPGPRSSLHNIHIDIYIFVQKPFFMGLIS